MIGTEQNSGPVLEVAGLNIGFREVTVVKDVSFTIAPGECVAIVGSSGAGKSITALSLVGLLPPGAKISANAMRIAGESVIDISQAQWRHLRGQEIALIRQDALSALDPLRRIGREVAEPMEIAGQLRGSALRDRVNELLDRVGIPDPAQRSRQYAHELSGGLRQRALIASGIAGSPQILIADEPTTALDAVLRRHILDLLAGMRDDGKGLLLISHDLAAVAAIADRVLVMHDGRIVEEGTAPEVLKNARHEATRVLLAAAPRVRSRPQPTSSSPLLRASGISRNYGSGSMPLVALQGIDLDVYPGQTVGVVGESGSGKSTLARLLLGLETPNAGEVHFGGDSWSRLAERHRRPMRGQIQLISQDPLGALQPRWSVARILAEALKLQPDTKGELALSGGRRSWLRKRSAELLEEVGLSEPLLDRKPTQLSGGQRQRVVIARALARNPRLLVCDEAVSALDAASQAQVLTLLKRLQRDRAMALVFISHDLDVIASIADYLIVLRGGHIVERGACAQILSDPKHEYTRELVSAGYGGLAQRGLPLGESELPLVSRRH